MATYPSLEGIFGQHHVRADKRLTQAQVLHLIRRRFVLTFNSWWFDCVKASEIGIKLDLSGADLCGLDLTGFDFADVNLSGADLSNTSCQRVNFNSAILVETRFQGADLSGASFHETCLRGLELSGANCRSAWFADTSVEWVDFSGADVEGAYFPIEDQEIKYRMMRLYGRPIVMRGPSSPDVW